jgi:hypothetical protein
VDSGETSMKDYIMAYSLFQIFTSPVVWVCVALTFVYGQVTQILTPPKPAPDPTICTEVSCPNPKKALAILNQLISKNPKDSQLYVSRGSTNCITKHISQCLSDYDTALEFSPDKADTYKDFGMTLLRIDRVRSAKAFDQAIKLYSQRGETTNVDEIRKIKSTFDL